MTFPHSERGGGRRLTAAWLVLLLGASCGSDSGNDRADDGPAFEIRGTTSTTTTTAQAGTTTSTSGVAGLPDGDDAVVGKIIDGDTLDLADGTRIRLIGIDTPETKDPRKPVECFGREASAQLASVLPPGTPIRLVYDVERLDRYGRTLAYLYRTSDGLFVNASMVRDGYASAFTVPPNVAHADEFVALQREARDANRGLWSACGSSQDTGGDAAPPAPGACDPSYPDVCIPSPPPDLDCGDVAYHRFRVEGSDPHGFDRDGDGVACEA